MPSEAQAVGAPRLSIVTVTWNAGDKLSPYLEALAQCRDDSAFELEVILVDNDSRDGTPDRIAAEAPWARLIRNPRNAGFAEGCNQGLAAARGEFLMLLNPDCFANSLALRGMVNYLREHPEAGAVGCTLLHGDGLPQRSAHREPSPLGFLLTNSLLSPILQLVPKLLYRLGARRGDAPQVCDWLMGSCIVIPRVVYERVGGLDETYFMYSEDADWCRRIRDTGLKVMFLPQFSMTHLHKASARGVPEFTFRRLYRSLLVYANKHLPPRARDRFCRAVLFDLHARRPLYSVLAILKPLRRNLLRARVASCTRLIEIFRARDPNLYDDPPPDGRNSP